MAQSRGKHLSLSLSLSLPNLASLTSSDFGCFSFGGIKILFSDLDATSSIVMPDSPGTQVIEGLPIEAFSQVHDIFNDLDWGDAINIIQQMTVESILDEKLDFSGISSSRNGSWQDFSQTGRVEHVEDNGGESLINGSKEAKSEVGSLASSPSKSSPSSGLHVSVQRTNQSKIISPRISQASPSNQSSYACSPQGLPGALTRYRNAPPSAVGITALLQDHAQFSEMDSSTSAPTLTAMKPTASPPPPPPPPPRPCTCRAPSSLPSPPPPPPPSNLSTVQDSPTTIPPPPPPSKVATPPPPPPPKEAPARTSQGVPPPPSKPGSTSPSLLSSANNLLGAKGKFLRTSTKTQAQGKKSSLKPYHWLKLTRAMQGSLWAEAQKPEAASKYVNTQCVHLYFH